MVGAVALIVIGVGAAVVVGRPSAAPAADPSTPVGVVQLYVEAVQAGDRIRARELLSQSARQELDKATGARPVAPRTLDRRILIEPVEQTPDRATVRVTLTRFTSRADPFSAGSYSNDTTVRLVREGGGWRIAEPIEPVWLY